MKLIPVNFSSIDEVTYIYYDEETKNCFVVDPGEDVTDKIKEKNLNLKAILLTHGHVDHIFSANVLKENFKDAIICAHENENTVLENPNNNLSKKFIGKEIVVIPDKLFIDNELFFNFKVIYTPGHTQGSVCYYCEENKVLFSGDTLFYKSVGRTDLPTSKPDAITKSIIDKLYTLPHDTIVYPGHGQKTTIGFEKKNNPYTIKYI